VTARGGVVQVGKPRPWVKSAGALQPARVVGEGSGLWRELRRRDHPCCERLAERGRARPFVARRSHRCAIVRGNASRRLYRSTIASAGVDNSAIDAMQWGAGGGLWIQTT
jgi:hypothetical protein